MDDYGASDWLFARKLCSIHLLQKVLLSRQKSLHYPSCRTKSSLLRLTRNAKILCTPHPHYSPFHTLRKSCLDQFFDRGGASSCLFFLNPESYLYRTILTRSPELFPSSAMSLMASLAAKPSLNRATSYTDQESKRVSSLECCSERRARGCIETNQREQPPRRET